MYLSDVSAPLHIAIYLVNVFLLFFKFEKYNWQKNEKKFVHTC